jgi:hypothetical protein
MQKLTIEQVLKMNGIIPPKTSGAIEKGKNGMLETTS